MQRRHSSNTDGMPAERSRSQTLGSESSLDESAVFDCLKPDSPALPQQIFSGLVGVPSGAVSSAQFQAASLVLGSPPEVFIHMTASSREEGGPRRPEGGPFLARQPHHNHHPHHHNFHHPPLQHRTSSLLQQATAAAVGSDRHHHGPREEVGLEDPSTPAPALSELKAVVTWLQRGFPFILILLAKVCFQHKLGIAVCVGMASTFAYANATFKHQVSLRGKFYLLIEELSQLFRALVPIQLWYKYIMPEEPSASYFLGATLIIIYSLCKSFDICGRASTLRKALVLLCYSQSYGVRAGSQQCSEAGDVCAICQADFREPVALLCQHVFCEECLNSWLDRERACPLCRATVVETVRCWKDGTTSAHFQIY
ncbi:RING finger and transmembrane domain-containing protein 2 isoform X3 [Phycodurus eques]|uniref:RING finger and transmembrane domain-containing protein 2 isoform X3 n=1 Tax=Phycodurus eques TaxID=693459 RepID=UPI002ACE5295|nr:RING finger and transmembrane domain-containing protein 2 isoform X3 [Phycodurus eques]